MLTPRRGRWRPSPEFLVAATYTAVAAAWVFASDRLLEGGERDPATAWAVATFKGLAFVAVTGTLLWLLLRSVRRREGDAARRLAASERHYRSAVEGSPDAIVVQSSGRIAYANPSAAQLLGARDPGELVGRAVLDFIDPAEHASLRTPDAPFPVKRVRRLRRLDGTPLVAEVAVRPYDLPGEQGLLLSIRDVTEPVRLQEELARVNGALRMLGRCNEAIVRAGSEAELLSEVCRVVVEEGEYRFAWIGRAEHDEARTLRPIARFGEGGEDLLGLSLTWAARADRQVTAGVALRSGEPCISPDLRTDPRFAPLAAEAAARGLAAAVALPIPIDGSPAYVLSFYALDRREFDAATVQVLRQLGEDLRHGLAALRTRAVLTGFLEHAPVPMFARTLDGRYVFVGRGWEETFGRRREEVVGRLVDEVFPGGRNPQIEAVDRQVVATRAAVRAEHTLDLGGRRRAFDLVEFPLLDAEGRISALCGFSREITEHRAAERALAAERAFLGSVLDNAGVLVGVADIEGRLVRMNREFERLTGWAPQELLGQPIAEKLLAPGERETVSAVLSRVLEEGAPVTFSSDFVTRSGERRTLEWVNTVVRDEEGRPTHVVGIGRDVTERLRIAAALAESEARYRQLVERSPSGIALVQDGRFLFANPAMVRLTGATAPEDLVGRPLADVLGGDRANAEARLRAVLAGEPLPSFEAEYRRLDGTRFAAEVTLSPLTLGGRPAVHAIAVDATERREAQRRLAESREQLRALAARIQGVREEEKARIARDLHDELGQLVTGLKMDLRWIERRVGELPGGDGAHALLDRAVAASELADQTVATVQRLAADLRPGALDRLGLGAALRQEGRAFEGRTGVRCEVMLEDGLPPLSDDLATALYRIAQEAMTNVARHAGAARVCLQLGRAEGAPAVRLRVEDDGSGIAAADASRPDALGLLGMRERAAALGGAVRIEAGAQGGTIVTAELPLDAQRELA